MQLDRYELKAGRSLTTFEFLSEGRKGKIINVLTSTGHMDLRNR